MLAMNTHSVRFFFHRKRCVPGKVAVVTVSRRKRQAEEEICPEIDVVPCAEPKECAACEKAIISYDQRCCTVVTCGMYLQLAKLKVKYNFRKSEIRIYNTEFRILKIPTLCL